jgi:hypothetical protein
VYVENAVIQTRRLELFLEPRYIDEICKLVGPGSAGNIRVSVEIKLIRSTANASLQCALDRVAADIVGAGVELGIQQRLRMAKVILCQLLEVITVHWRFVPISRSTNWRGYYNIQYGEGGRFLTRIDGAAGKLRLSRAKLGSFFAEPAVRPLLYVLGRDNRPSRFSFPWKTAFYANFPVGWGTSDVIR